MRAAISLQRTVKHLECEISMALGVSVDELLLAARLQNQKLAQFINIVAESML
jgi:hypothetical protein